MAKIDAITTPKFTFDEGSAPSTPASGKVVTYAKSDGLMYSKDDAGVETVMSGGGGGGGITQAYVGYNTIGGTTFTPTLNLMYMKKVTISTACLFADVEVYLYNNGASAQVGSFPKVFLLTDAAGAPGQIISMIPAANQTDTFFPANDLNPTSADGRWYGGAIGRWATAADYWIGFQFVGDIGSILCVNDGSGSDVTCLPGGAWIVDPTAATGTMTTTSNKYSIRANTIA